MNWKKLINYSLATTMALFVQGLFQEKAQAFLLHQWTFNDGTARDLVGSAHGSLFNGAHITNGQLVLDGVNDYMRTSTINQTITTKTLLVWGTLANLTQRNGGLLTLEDPRGTDTFDSIVYAERTSRQWLAGSNNYTRTPISNGGSLESSLEQIMLAITYGADNRISLYRNGLFYASYTQGTLQTYSSGIADVLMGVRHADCISNISCYAPQTSYFGGQINEARIYGTALSAAEIQAIYNQGPVQAVPTPSLLVPIMALGIKVLRRHKQLEQSLSK